MKPFSASFLAIDLPTLLEEPVIKTPEIKEVPQRPVQEQANQAQTAQKLQEQRKQMLDAIGKDAFNGVNIFEGTTPTSAPSQPGHGPLAGADPKDPGVDISNFANSGVWKKLAGN